MGLFCSAMNELNACMQNYMCRYITFQNFWWEQSASARMTAVRFCMKESCFHWVRTATRLLITTSTKAFTSAFSSCLIRHHLYYTCIRGFILVLFGLVNPTFPSPLMGSAHI